MINPEIQESASWKMLRFSIKNEISKRKWSGLLNVHCEDAKADAQKRKRFERSGFRVCPWGLLFTAVDREGLLHFPQDRAPGTCALAVGGFVNRLPRALERDGMPRNTANS